MDGGLFYGHNKYLKKKEMIISFKGKVSEKVNERYFWIEK